MSLVANLVLYAACPLPQALSSSASDALAFFGSKAFEDWKKSRQSEIKLQEAVISGQNEIIKAIGVLAKIMAR